MHGADLEVWIVDLARSATLAEVVEARERLLADDEHQRLAAIADGGQRRERMTAYVALRVLIQRRLGHTLERCVYARTGEGKPFIDGAPLAFSLSHTDGWAAIALARSEPIGIDIEAPRARQLAEPHRDRLLAAARGLAGCDLPAGDDAHKLLAAWVRIEACAKAQGGGIARLLTALGVRSRHIGEVEDLAAVERRAGELAEAHGLQVCDIAGQVAAVTAARGSIVPQVAQFPTDWTALDQWRRP